MTFVNCAQSSGTEWWEIKGFPRCMKLGCGNRFKVSIDFSLYDYKKRKGMQNNERIGAPHF